MDESRDGQSAARSVPAVALTDVLLAVATVVLLVDFFLPWWSVRVVAGVIDSVPYSASIDGLSGWGWLSVAGWLVALASMTRVLVVSRRSPGKRVDSSTGMWVIFAAGLAELLGNVLFFVAAPKSETFITLDRYGSIGLGLIIASAGGLALIVGALLALGRKGHRTPELSSQPFAATAE